MEILWLIIGFICLYAFGKAFSEEIRKQNKKH